MSIRLRFPSVLLLLFLAGLPARVQAQSGGPILSFPAPGDALQGVVTVRGVSGLPGFTSAELCFAYASDPTDTWFLIGNLNQPVVNAPLAAWDTTIITDGDYVLRLRVYLADGSYQQALVTGLRVRNYTAVETPTPPAAVAQATGTPTEPPVATLPPTPSPLPPNPAEIAPIDMRRSLIIGGATAVSLFALLGFSQWIRRKRS
jgi:hypothetical protein